MSGPICPDCGLYSFEELSRGHLKCRICGWQGKNLPSKIMGGKMQRSKSQEMSKMQKLRQEGNLFYFKIDMKGSEDDIWEATSDIMELFDINSISGSERLIFYLTKVPSKEKINRLKKIKEVKKIKIF